MTGEDLIREIRKFDPYVQIILQTGYSGEKPASQMMAELDIQGYHDKADGPEKLLLWVDVGLKAHRLISKLRERERLQTELVANVSHEFRTPLHIIGGYTDLLLQGEFGDLPEPARQSLQPHGVGDQQPGGAGLRSAALRPGSRPASPTPRRSGWSTDDLASEMERLAGLLLEGKDVTFAVDVDEAPDGFAADLVKLRTILRNLVTNAVKFTTRGSIALRLWREEEPLQLAVIDSGSGIAAADQEIIFEPFRQLDGSATRLYRGIGLGLALSRKLARILGGELSVDSEPGVGSTFLLSLPLRIDEQVRAAEEESVLRISQVGAVRAA